MKNPANIRYFASLVLASALLAGPGAAVFAQSTASQDMKTAGTDTKDAAKDAGNGVKKGTTKAYHKTKAGSATAYDKTKEGKIADIRRVFHNVWL